MNFTSSKNRRNLLVVFITLLIVFETNAYISRTPRPKEQYFGFYVLGVNMLAAQYYPGGGTDIQPGEWTEWQIGLRNLMGNMQSVAILVKLGNMTISPPNDRQASPSPAQLVTELKRFVQDNETWQIPFVWRISNASYSYAEDSVRILELQINNRTFPVRGDTSARHPYNFRLIFELWTWNVETAAMQFGWWSATEHRVAWLQVWFSIPGGWIR